MRRIRYAVAMSLDGYIAGPNGEYDWIELDPTEAGDYFKRFYAQFDTALLGRKSFEQFPGAVEGLRTYVLSRSLPPGERGGVTFLGTDALERSSRCRARGFATDDLSVRQTRCTTTTAEVRLCDALRRRSHSLAEPDSGNSSGRQDGAHPKPTIVPLTDIDAIRAAGVRYPETVDGWRWLYRQRVARGMTDVFLRVGRRIMIDLPAYEAALRKVPVPRKG